MLPSSNLIVMLKKTCLALSIIVLLFISIPFLKAKFARLLFASKNEFTIISAIDHRPVSTDQDIKKLIALLHDNKDISLNEKVAFAAHYFENRPSRLDHIEGEGDLCPGSINHHGCAHLQQDPIYRTDFFACNTLVQIVLASVYSKDLRDFKRLILQIEYGAAHEPSESIHYYNRNNFISVDFNPVNQKHGFIVEATRSPPFADFVKTSTAVIDRESWFNQQLKKGVLNQTIRVLSPETGPAMLWRATQYYPQKLHHFKSQTVKMDYIPKEVLVLHKEDIEKLPTPAIVEIVRDPSKWFVGGKKIAEVTGSEIAVSHLGLIYRQVFKKDEIIYQKIICSKQKGIKTCKVDPVVCDNPQGCDKVMFSHATMAYPDGYAYYQDAAGQYHCDAKAPSGVTSTTCNRVVSLPLVDYLTLYQYGRYVLMEEKSILGIHIEKINAKT